MTRKDRLRRTCCAVFMALGLAGAFALPAPAQEGEEAPLIQIVPVPPSGGVLPEPGAEPEQYAPAPIQRDLGGRAPQPRMPVVMPLLSTAPNAADQNGILRVQGEYASEAFRLFLPPMTQAAQLTLSYRSTINVLPERSLVQVFVNGREAGSFAPSSFAGFSRVSLPGTDLRPGVNDVRIVFRHHHRIFCGTDVSFSLWSELDLRQSGVQVADFGDLPDAEAFVAGIASHVARGQPLEIRSPAPGHDTLARDIAARLGNRLGLYLPVREVSSWAPATGPAAAARISILPAGSGGTGFRRGGDGAIVLVLEEGTPLSEIDRLVPDLPPPPRTALLQPGVTTPISDLGYADHGTTAHYDRSDVIFRMPDDWLILASQKAELGFDYGFSDGLPAGALLLVKVNGETVRLLPLDTGAEERLPRLQIRFNARMLRPGVNAITFEAMIPGDPPDQPCPVRHGPMLTIYGDTDLTVPDSPDMAMADMSTALARLDGSRIATPPEALAPEPGPAGILPLAGMIRPLIPVQEGAEPPQLMVIGPADAPLMPLGLTGVTAQGLVNVISARPAGTATGADEVPPLERARLFLRNLVTDDAGRAEDWLAAQSGVAVLVQPDPAQPRSLWLLVAPRTDLTWLAGELSAARDQAGGPAGQIAVLRADGSWSNWRDPAQPPRMLEPLSAANLTVVLGSYASWAPLGFMGILLVLAWLSGLVALTFVLATRERRR